MIEFICDAWRDSLFIGILITIGMFLAIGGLGVLGFLIADECWIAKQEGVGKIVDRYHKDSYVTTTLMSAGKTLIPMTQFHPESWNLEIEMQDGRSDTLTIDHLSFDKIKKGERVNIIYGEKRFSGGISIESFSRQ